MKLKLWIRSAIIASVISCIWCLPLFLFGPFAEVAYPFVQLVMQHIPPERIVVVMWLIPLALPGMLLSMALAKNVHAFSAWIALIGNLVFYTFVIVVVTKIVRKFRAQ